MRAHASEDLQVEALAAWLATHGHLLRSLDYSPPSTLTNYPLYSEEERAAAEKAVASAFSKAASTAAGGLQLQTCKLAHASSRIADLVEQLPSHSLTRLTLNILQLTSTTAQPLPYISGL